MKRAVRLSSIPAALVAAAALGAPMLASAAAGVHAPTATTDKVLRVRGSSAELTGAVNPHGLPTTYFFQFGPTTAYAFHTAPGSAGSGTKGVRVGQFVHPFLLGYHYRIVATNAAGTKFGRDFVFLAKGTKLGIELFPFSAPTAYGHKVVVRGRITGPGVAGHQIVLQASPWPYHEAFESVGRPAIVNAAGLFAFNLGVLPISTQFRAYEVQPLPKVSKVLTVQVAVRVTLKVRSSSQPGLVRLFGTVTPVEVGARVELQVKRPVRPGKSEKKEERTTRFATQAIGVVKRATKRISRFSVIVSIRRPGWYRAFVLTPNGSVVPGGSHAVYIRTPAHGHKAH
jgi:hypothetical protein